MTTELPTTLADCFAWLRQNLTEKQLTDLASLSQSELWQTHFTLVPLVKKGLLENNPGLQQRLDQSAFCDDPDMAGQIITAFWDQLRMEKPDN